MIVNFTVPKEAFLVGEAIDVVKKQVFEKIVIPSNELGYEVSLKTVKVAQDPLSGASTVIVEYIYRKMSLIQEIEDRLEIGL